MDELDQCNEMLGKETNLGFKATGVLNNSRRPSLVKEGSKTRKYFPFEQGFLSVATLRVGSEGIQMTVDGKHITSFAFRDVISVAFSTQFYLDSRNLTS